MATGGLALVGALFGPVGSFLGSVIGSYIDSQFLFPALFGPGDQTVHGPRIDDFRLQTASEGSGMNFCMGPFNRVAGTVIWMSPIREVVTTETQSSGGKGGGGGSVTTKTYSYYCDIAIGLCEGPIVSVPRFWADSKKIFEDKADIDLTGQVKAQRVFSYISLGGIFGDYVSNVWLKLTAPNGGIDLTQFASGQDVVISGFGNSVEVTSNRLSIVQADFTAGTKLRMTGPNSEELTSFFVGQNITISGFSTPANNGTFLVFEKEHKKDPITGEWYTDLTIPFSFGQTVEGEGNNVTVSATLASGGNNGTFKVDHTEVNSDGSTSLWIKIASYEWNNGTAPLNETRAVSQPQELVNLVQTPIKFDPTVMSAVQFKFGTPGQSISSIISAHEGSDIPAFRGTAYVVIKDLLLSYFGNRVPVFNFHVEADAEGFTYKQAIEKVLKRAGRSPSDYDTSALSTTQKLWGYTINGPHQTNKILEQLLLAGNLNVKQADGKLVFYPRGSEPLIDVDVAYLGPYELKDEPPPPLVMQDPDPIDLPIEVEVKFIKKDETMEQGSRTFQRIVREADAIETFDIPLTLTNGEAEAIARRLLFDTWLERNPGVIVLPPSFIGLNTGQRIRSTKFGEGFVFRTTEVNRGANSIHEARGIILDVTELDPGVEEDEIAPPVDPPVYTPPALTLLQMDAPALREEDIQTVGHYYGICASDIAAEWLGAGLYISNSAQGTYNFITNVPVEAKIFRTDTVLAPGPVGYIDRKNTVDVTMLHGAPVSCTEDELIAGSNRVWIGNELIAFQEAENLGNNRYRLSVLLRGLRNSESGMTQHQVNEFGIIADAGGVQFRPFPTAEVGVIRYFKAVPVGETISEVDPEPFAFSGRSVKEFGPCHIKTRVDGKNNYVVTWVRRTRAFYSAFSGDPVPLVPGFEKYEIDLLRPDGTVHTTYVVQNATTVTIKEADRTAAGYGANDPVSIKIYPIGEIIARGIPTEAEVG